MTSSDFKAHSEPIFKELKVLKFQDMVRVQNCLFVHDFLNGNLPNSFENTFSKVESTHKNVELIFPPYELM